MTTVILLVGLLSSCSKKDSQPTPLPSPPSLPSLPTPTITSFEITDYCLRKITITGTNFNPDVTKDSVFIGATKGLIDSATSTKIFATFPPGTPSDKLLIYANGISATSTEIVTLNLAPLSIVSFSPLSAGPGAIVTVTGTNFNPDASKDSVFFNNIKATIISATATQITAVVPQNAPASSKISVFTNCQSAASSVSFTFSNKGIVYTAGNSGFCYAIDITSGTVIWKVETHSKGFSAPTYANGKIYIGSTDGNILSNNHMYALDALTGAQLWKYNAGPWDLVPAIHQDVLYAGAYDKNFYAFNATTGQKIWSFTAGDYFRAGSPTYYKGNVYTRNDDGHFYSLNAANGAMNWRLKIWPGGNPSIVNGIVYVAGPGNFYALDAATGDIKWNYPMQYLSGSSPTVVHGKVYIATENHRLFALDAATGSLLWSKTLSWFASTAVIVVNNILYASISDGTFYAIDATNGETLWTRSFPPSRLGGFCPVVANDIVFVGDYAGGLNALDAKTGNRIWRVSTGAYPILSSPCVVDENGAVYHAGDSGNQQ